MWLAYFYYIRSTGAKGLPVQDGPPRPRRAALGDEGAEHGALNSDGVLGRPGQRSSSVPAPGHSHPHHALAQPRRVAARPRACNGSTCASSAEASSPSRSTSGATRRGTGATLCAGTQLSREILLSYAFWVPASRVVRATSCPLPTSRRWSRSLGANPHLGFAS